MNLSRKSFFSVITAIVLLSLSSLLMASTPAPPERPLQHVVDLAGIVTDDVEVRLNSYLTELESKTSSQVALLTVDSLDGEDIETFSLGVAEKWGLGQKEKDNGLLIVVSVADKRYRFEVGYGLEGVLPDSFVGTLGRKYLVPHFRTGDYTGGLAAAVLSVAKRIADDSGVSITGLQRDALRSRRTGVGRVVKPTVGGVIFTFLSIALLIYLFIKHPRLLLLIIMMSMMGGGRRRGWGGGGGFGGGGGGFGGGGGSGGW